MDATERAHLLDTYIENLRNGSDETFWAWERFDDEARRGSDLVWTLILEALARDLDDPEFYRLAAGPLDDLINGHCDRFIERIENEAKKNEEFQDLLLGLWIRVEDIGEDMWRRLAIAAGERIEELSSRD